MELFLMFRLILVQINSILIHELLSCLQVLVELSIMHCGMDQYVHLSFQLLHLCCCATRILRFFRFFFFHSIYRSTQHKETVIISLFEKCFELFL